MRGVGSREKAIAELLDRQAILDALTRYARGVDRLDEELILSAFWPGAHDAHGPTNGSVAEFLASWLPSQAGREAGQHFLVNHTVAFDGTEAADCETYLLVAIKSEGATTVDLMGGRYVDRFEKRHGEWRIATRLCLVDWATQTDGTIMPAWMSRVHRGSRDRTDPSYESPVRRRWALDQR